MEINVRKIADLAALKIEEDKFSSFEAQFMDIIKMMSELPECDEYEIIPQPMELRDDIIEDSSISRNELMSNACEVVNDCFTAPQTVEY
ncbi:MULTISPECIES: Asp-tRNA(Asn)/Glu-tRNA(Gln) amidotransferase subunit GatC [Ruminococcus]|uniref:Aspartyl/glutamyl-tRNA(Asn/Gln) amidotransferase subunit C n=1 Tax=Ruminococcus flavefaciens TaxID=1265 RepID=A0A1M7HCF4_RUMFL|nr:MULTISPECIES: aspartyl/glutamyl-tRNA amidotransferase subunit C [Ruminococcus]MCR4795374.1 aspartyl/glutamyl-tRNA amidotransferase subunit C [Ruminococcus sp.]SHM26155.1 aspartyl/glutamyl-tRNA(Asn/Gln) amidotransferase subunit C [Ruminococcus flavefaciens]